MAVGGRLVAAAISFFAVRYYLDWFGKEGYGVYLVAGTVMQYLNLLDLNYGVGAQKFMVEALLKGERERADRIMRSQMTLYLGTALLGLVALSLFGALVPFTKDGTPRLQSFAAFAFTGVIFATNLLTQTLTNGALAHGKMMVAVQSAVFKDTLIAVSTLLFAFYLRTIAGLAFGAALGSVVSLAFFVLLLRRRAPEVRPAIGWDWPLVKEFSRIGLRNVPNSVVGSLANRGDRLLLSFGAGTTATLTDYANASKPDDLAFTLLGPIVPLFTPEVTRSLKEGSEAAARTVNRNGLTIWAVGCALVLVPTAGGDVLLRLWIHDKTVAQGGLVMALMAIYFVSELHFNVLASLFLAKGNPHRLFRFPLANAILTLVLTLPLYRAYGLVGVAAMNATIALAQLAPRAAMCDAELDGRFRWKAYLGRCLAIVGVSGLAWLGLRLGMARVDAPGVGKATLLLSLLACLLAGGGVLALFFATGLAPIPGVLAARLRRRAS